MLDLDEAKDRILAAIPAAAGEVISLWEARGRVLLQDIHSPLDLPVFDNSSVDGYAVRAKDLKDAASDAPVRLSLRGRVAAGEIFAGQSCPGECVRLFTGSPIPPGADAVLMQEDARVDAGNFSTVWCMDSVKPLENVRLRGQDVKRGGRLAAAGSYLTSGALALLAAVGTGEVRVGRRPTVGLVSTGSELIEAGKPLPPGAIYESNRVALAALTIQAGGAPRIFPLVRDDPAGLETALRDAFAQCDVVVTSGGVSVGELDFVKSAFERSGGELDFWKVAIKPGKPFLFGRRDGKFLFGLPGNPVSAFVTFLLLVRPALARWQGASEAALPACRGVLAESLENPGDRRHFMRVIVNSSGEVRLAGAQGAHILSSLAAANGLVDVPPGAVLPAGAAVAVLRWD